MYVFGCVCHGCSLVFVVVCLAVRVIACFGVVACLFARGCVYCLVNVGFCLVLCVSLCALVCDWLVGASCGCLIVSFCVRVVGCVLLGFARLFV